MSDPFPYIKVNERRSGANGSPKLTPSSSGLPVKSPLSRHSGGNCAGLAKGVVPVWPGKGKGPVFDVFIRLEVELF